MSPKLLNILLVVVPVFLYFGYIEPMYLGTQGFIWTPEKNLSTLKSENVQYIDAINQISAIEQASIKLNKEYTAIPIELVERINLLLPESIDPVRLRNEITSIAANSGVALTGLTITHEEKDSSYKVSFSVRARYGLFKKFMESYEKSTRMFTLISLSISRVSPGESNEKSLSDAEEALNKLKISVTSKVYYKKK